ncbi:Photosystem I assembly protein Ycf3 [subsurface metagenome]
MLGGEEFIEDSSEGETFTFDLYRIPFNDGEGGTPEPVRGASNNGKSNYFAKFSPDGKWIVFCQARSFMLLQPDSKLFIMPADMSEEPREMVYNMEQMNSWHSWSPNSKWLVFSSKENSAYTELFLKHIDENGNDSPPVLLSQFSSNDRARNIPEFVNIPQGGIEEINESFVNYYSYKRKGYELMRLGKLEASEKAYRTAIELNPEFPDSHSELGYLLARMNRPEEAEEEFIISLDLMPDDHITLTNLGVIFLNRQDTDKARELFEKALKLDPNYAQAHDGLGTISLVSGNLHEAREKFELALKLDPELADSHYRLGTIYMRDGEFDKAEKEFEQVLDYQTDSRAYMGLGTIYNQRGELEKAIDNFTQALRFDPTNFEALRQLGTIYINRKEMNKAETIFRKAYLAKPNHPGICVLLGRLFAKNKGTIPDAIKLYSKALTIAPLDIQAHIEFGNLLLDNGDRARAINEFEIAFKLNPEAEDLREYIDTLINR